jgi:hypothetical protein
VLEVMVNTAPLTATVAPETVTAAAAAAKSLQFAVMATVCSLPPSTVTSRLSAVASAPASSATVPNSSKAFEPLPDAVMATELDDPVVSDVS